MGLAEKMNAKKLPKKLLALDGGGIRGMISVEILAKIETLLRAELGRGKDFRLCEYFDYVAGTSTGAIIATCLSWGMSVDEIRKFYLESGGEMFDKARLLSRFRYTYEDKKISNKLKEVFGSQTTLGTSKLNTLLMMVMRNASTDSPWSVSNNPRAKYNEKSRVDCNLNIPLWQLIRASTAAPTFFPPEVVEMGPNQIFVFVDGGITPYNNPAFQLFLMATLEPYRLNWSTGEDQMLVVSIGTGTSPEANDNLGPSDMNLLYNAASLPSALMFASLNEQDLLCRVFGQCLAGDLLDREVGDLIKKRGPVQPKLFTYVRYNAELTLAGLKALGLGKIKPKDVQQLDSVKHVKELQQIGRAVGAKKVRREHFKNFLS